MTVGTTEDRMQCLISKFTVSALGQVWDYQSYREVIPSVPFPLSTGEWEVLFNNRRSSLIKRVNITVIQWLGAAHKGGRGLTSFFMPGCGVYLGQPKTFSDPFAGALGLRSSLVPWAVRRHGRDVCCSHVMGGQKCGQKKFPLCT